MWLNYQNFGGKPIYRRHASRNNFEPEDRWKDVESPWSLMSKSPISCTGPYVASTFVPAGCGVHRINECSPSHRRSFVLKKPSRKPLTRSPQCLAKKSTDLPTCPAVLDAEFGTKVQSFLSKMKISSRCDVRVPSFAGEGRTDRDGTAVIPPSGGGLSRVRGAEVSRESKDSGTGRDGHKSDDGLQSRTDRAWLTFHSDGGRVEEIDGPCRSFHSAAISGSAGSERSTPPSRCAFLSAYCSGNKGRAWSLVRSRRASRVCSEELGVAGWKPQAMLILKPAY